MKAQYPSVPFLLLIMVILIVGQFSSCYNTQKITKQRFKTESGSSFSTDPKASRNGDTEQSCYRVSNHAVPGGPNPLHN